MPKRVTIAPGSLALANEGRSAYWLSRLLSRPVVMLNGGPERAVMKGVSLSQRGIVMLALAKTL